MASKKTYVAQADGFLHGEHRKKRSKLELTDREAKYLLLSGLVKADEPEQVEAPKKEEPDPATLERKTR